MSAVSQSKPVVATRRYAVAPETVYRVLTDPALIVRWWSPSADIPVVVETWELERGGRWRFAYLQPDGIVSIVGGTFREISPGERLVFTWIWEPPDPHAGVETLVTIVLAPVPGGTELTVTHERFPDRATRDRHDVGWQTTLDRLEESLA